MLMAEPHRHLHVAGTKGVWDVTLVGRGGKLNIPLPHRMYMYSSVVINTDMNGRVCGALAIVRLLSAQT